MADEADDDNDGFTQVWRSKAKPNYLMSNVMVKYMSDKWNKYFETVTGHKMNPPFEFTPGTFPYASSMECRRNLDNVLLGQCNGAPRIWDLTCGSGSDAIIFAYRYGCKKLDCVDSMATEEFQVTIQNMISYGNTFPFDYPSGSIIVEGQDENSVGWSDSCKIHLHNTPLKQFITAYAHRTPLPKIGYHLIDICYIDPSWCAKELLKQDTINENLDRNRQAYDYQHIPATLEQEANPEIVMSYIVNQIIAPIEAAKIVINVLCLKVRFELSSAEMQKYLDNSHLDQRFIVLYAVQALPNIQKRNTKEVNGEPVIMDYDRVSRTSKQRPFVKLDGGTKIIKGQFHWLVMRNIKYKKVNDIKRLWAEKEMLGAHPEPVYVLKDTAVTETPKPEYGEKVIERPVLTKTEFDHLTPPEERGKYEEITAVRSLEQVHEEDMQAYTGMLNELENLLHKNPEEHKKQKLINLIENILQRCWDYRNPQLYNPSHYKAAAELQHTAYRLDAMVTEFYKSVNKTRQFIGKPPTRRMRANLGALLQQLRSLGSTD